MCWGSSCCRAGRWPCWRRVRHDAPAPQLALRRGLDLNVNMLGRWAVWPVMGALAVTLVVESPVAEILLYVGLAMTLAATAVYLQDGLRAVRAPDAQPLVEDSVDG